MFKKKSSAVEPKVGDQYLTINKGRSGEYKVKVLKRQPKNWKEIKGARTAPRGYIWVSNNKSLFSGERKTALVKDKKYHKAFPTEVEPVKTLGDSTSNKRRKNNGERKEEKERKENHG